MVKTGPMISFQRGITAYTAPAHLLFVNFKVVLDYALERW